MTQANYAAYVRVSTDDQDVANQEMSITEWANNGNHQIKWFKEEGVSSSTDWHERHILHDCLDYCRRNGATLVIYSVSRLTRRSWEGLRFLEQEVKTGKIDLVVIDNPHLDHNTIGLLAAVSEMERSNIRERTKISLARIQKMIEETGSYTTKEGKVITALGMPNDMSNARDVKIKKAKARANQIRPILESLVEQKLSYREMANRLNDMGVETPAKRMNPDISKRTQWFASSVRNYVKRMEVTVQ